MWSGPQLHQIRSVSPLYRIDRVKHRSMNNPHHALRGVWRGDAKAWRNDGDGFLVPIGDDVGESWWRRTDQGDCDQSLAKTGMHVALLWLSTIHPSGLLIGPASKLASGQHAAQRRSIAQ
jgi:hypothetical protein